MQSYIEQHENVLINSIFIEYQPAHSVVKKIKLQYLTLNTFFE